MTLVSHVTVALLRRDTTPNVAAGGEGGPDGPQREASHFRLVAVSPRDVEVWPSARRLGDVHAARGQPQKATDEDRRGVALMDALGEGPPPWLLPNRHSAGKVNAVPSGRKHWLVPSPPTAITAS
jgi:hypothetical protein